MKKTKFISTFFAVCCLGAIFSYFYFQPSLEQMVGQMIITGFHGDGENSNNEDFKEIENQIKKGIIGGVILFDVDVHGLLSQGMTLEEAKKQIFSSNIKNVNQVKKLNEHLQSLSSQKLLIAIDQEGGEIQRLKPEHGFAPTPSAAELGQKDLQTTYTTAYNLGKRLYDIGINVNFAPLLDVNVNKNSPAIGAKNRSFSSDYKTVTQHAKAFAKGLQDANIAYSFKHFPGHGSAGTDSHNGITDVTNTYQDYELQPWKDLLKTPNPYTMVMVAHIINKNFDTLPASLSEKTIRKIRNMGFDGVIISDDMDMGAITNEYGTETAVEMAINAGNDILIFGNNLTFDRNRGKDINDMIVKMVKSGQIQKKRIQESYRRIKKMKSRIK